MVRKLSGMVGALVAILAGPLWSIAANAQDGFPQPPIRPSVDDNGVELVSGALRSMRRDIVIGQPGAGGLSFGAMAGQITDTTWYSGAVTKTAGPTTTIYTVSFGGHAESFTQANSPPNSPFVGDQGSGSTLTENGANYNYTTPDGTVAYYSKSLTRVVNVSAAAYIQELDLPDGESRYYNYVSATCLAGCYNPDMTPNLTRLQAVTNNRGYQIKLIYADSRVNTTIPAADIGGWYTILSAIGINMAVDYCDASANACTGLTQSWPTVSYSSGYSPVPTIVATDQLGNTTTYTYDGNYEHLSIRLPGSQSDDVVYSYVAGTQNVQSVNRHGRTWNYSYSSTSTELTTVVADPQSRQSTYVFDATTRSIKSYTTTAGEVTTYQNDANGRPSIITLPTGETVRYQYDARGNVTEVRRTSSPAGSPDLVWTASYDPTCTSSYAKKCNKPNWTRDPAGNQTDYVYATTHGNPTSVTQPAAPNGVRPVTNYTYTPYQAYYHYGNSYIPAGPQIYVLTSVAQCRTTSSCDGLPDQLRTEIGYGADNVGNNRLPVQTTVRDGAGTFVATTSLQYDGVGNLVVVDGPLPGPVDQTVTRYDALRRVIGTVGPDPDDGGSRPNIAVRTTYDARGLPTGTDTGNLPGQSDSAWASFVPAQSVVREFDADHRLTKTSLAAGGTTYAVQQVSYDALGRVDCRATRMNPGYFGAPPDACTATSDSPSFGPDRIIKYGYDSADRVTSVTSGFGRSDAIVQQAMTYFPGGRLNTLSDGKGNKTTYAYDPYGRLFRTYYPHPTTVGASSSTDYEEYGYNVSSQVTSIRRRSGDVIGTPRDALGRITLKDVPGSAEDVYFSYDNQGRLLSALFNNGTGVNQTYDGLGRMDTRTVFGRQLLYQYDLRGRRTRLTHPDGFYVTYGYSNLDELLSVTDSAGATVATYSYNGLGARTSLSRPNGTSTSYTPDALERLQTLTQDLSGSGFDLSESFTYNPAGQISTKTSSNDAAYTPVPSPPNSTLSAQFDGQNQLTSFAGASVADDANANVNTGISSLAYTYDALGQLRQASGGANAALVDYDPTGMLRRVTVGGTTTEYLYDGADLIAEYNGSGTVLRRFVHGAGDDEPLVAYEGSGTTSKSWLHADERGSIIAASDASGVAASSVKYTADGDSATLASPFGYTGQLYLPEVQLYYYKARMYSPKAGRFLQPDPIGYDGGMNLYGYASNDPVNFRDPSGGCDQWVNLGLPTYTWDNATNVLTAMQRQICLGELNAATAGYANTGAGANANGPGGANGGSVSSPTKPSVNFACESFGEYVARVRAARAGQGAFVARTAIGTLDAVAKVNDFVGTTADLTAAAGKALGQSANAAEAIGGASMAIGIPFMVQDVYVGIAYHKPEKLFDGSYGGLQLALLFVDPMIPVGMGLAKLATDLAKDEPASLISGDVATPMASCPPGEVRRSN